MGTPNFRFVKKDAPDYNPYGTAFSERQLRIIHGLPVKDLKLRELTTIIRKAEKLGTELLIGRVYELHGDMTSDYVEPKYTLEEAQAILQSLTPWER